MKRITVLLADDHTVVREGFRALLRAEEDLEVIGEATTGRLAVEMTRQLQPAVVIMDIAMPLLNGVEATRQIRAAFPMTKVLIFSAYSSDEYIERVLTAGADGFLLKQSSSTLLAKAIRSVAKGETFFDPAIAKHLITNYRKSAQADPATQKIKRLSSREEEILQLVAEGSANKQMADILGLSIKTIEKHRQRLMNKLGIHNTAGLTRYAINNGVIEEKRQGENS
ncbi:MAG TPA: response regulator transcription factor [Opitutales bacterium]|jgi:DNA-binding NarL/FixJ family response regulator|nr:response regulator transcription factor [Opitutales bacterium]